MRKLQPILALLACATIYGAPCHAQYDGYPNFGFRSYANTGRARYNSGMAGYSNNNSFNSGFSGMGQTYNGMVYSTSRSTAAVEELAQGVSAIWGNVMGRAAQSQRQSSAQMQQTMSKPAQTYGLLPPMSKQQMLRIFLEGGTPDAPAAAPPSGGANNSAATSTAYSNYQTAQNESTKARNAADRVRGYDKGSWSKKDDAQQAEYAANNAEYAAQRAESAAYNGDSQAQGYARLAREAANRARGYANQARYNANT